MKYLFLVFLLVGCGATEEEKEKEKAPDRGILVVAPEGKEWSGAVGEGDSIVSRNGSGSFTFRFDNTVDDWGATLQKETPGDWELRLVCVIFKDQREEASTVTEFGVASLSCGLGK
jgi:hypothetical protein